MKKEKEVLDQEEEKTANTAAEEKTTEDAPQEEPATEEVDDEEDSEEDDLEVQLSEAKDKYLRLYSEFENFRRRTAKERIDLITTASREVIEAMLPVMDDFERAIKAGEGSEANEGTILIYNKFKNILEGKGLKRMEINAGDEFDDDFHDAITQIPAPEKKLAGKIVDVVEPGYFLGEKVIRFAKVVTAAK